VGANRLHTDTRHTIGIGATLGPHGRKFTQSLIGARIGLRTGHGVVTLAGAQPVLTKTRRAGYALDTDRTDRRQHTHVPVGIAPIGFRTTDVPITVPGTHPRNAQSRFDAIHRELAGFTDRQELTIIAVIRRRTGFNRQTRKAQRTIGVVITVSTAEAVEAQP
jgi:hypothetical protein